MSLRCSYCNSDNLIKKDFRGDRQRYLCKECGTKMFPVEDNPTQTMVVIPDTHYPEQDKRAVNCVLEFIEWYQPSHLTHIGDVGEFASVSHHDKDKPLIKWNKTLQDDVDQYRECLDEFGSIAPHDCKKVVCFGNHEHRVPRFVERIPEMSGLRSVDLVAVTKAAGWIPYEYLKLYRIGKLGLFHGAYCNMYHAAKTLREYGVSVMYGHTHDRQTFWHQFHGGERSAQSIGCLCNLNPGWRKNKPNRWCHGFASITFDSNGNFFPTFHKIVNGVTYFNGRKFGG